MAPRSTSSQCPPVRHAANTHFRPLNAFMAFRSHFNKMLLNMQQKERSGVLTTLWRADPHKNKWTMVAKVFSYLRAELGKDAVSLPLFLKHACSVLKIPPLDIYLQQRGFFLLENEIGKLTLVPRAEKITSASSQSTVSSEGEGSPQNAPVINPKQNTGIDLLQSQFQVGSTVTIDRYNFRTLSSRVSITSEDNCFNPHSRSNISTLDEASLGLFAEHQLLQAVFDRGLEVDLSQLVNGGDASLKKQWLVKKLYSMANEMLIGGEVHAALDNNDASPSFDRNLVTTVSQDGARKIRFPVEDLVLSNVDHVKSRILCQRGLKGSQPSSLISASERKTIMTKANSEESTTKQNIPSPPQNSTPTYTQNMIYQSSSHAGKFHIFSSQPSQLGKIIISTSELGRGDPSCPRETECQSMVSGVRACMTRSYVSSTHDIIPLDHEEYNLDETPASHDFPESIQHEGGFNHNLDALNSMSRRGSLDFLSDDGTLVDSEYAPSEGHSDGGMSSWIARELEHRYNSNIEATDVTTLNTTTTDVDNNNADCNSGVMDCNPVKPLRLAAPSTATSSTASNFHTRQQDHQKNEHVTTPTSSLRKRGRDENSSDDELEDYGVNLSCALTHDDADQSLAGPKGKVPRKAMKNKPEPSRRGTRSCAVMDPAPLPQYNIEHDLAPSQQPAESSQAAQTQPRESISSVTSASASASLRSPSLLVADSLSPVLHQANAASTSPGLATATGSCVAPSATPAPMTIAMSSQQLTQLAWPPHWHTVENNVQTDTTGQSVALHNELHHHHHYHHGAAAQYPVHRTQATPQVLTMGISYQPAPVIDTTSPSVQAMRSFQNVQEMHASHTADEMQTMQEVQAIRNFDSMQGIQSISLPTLGAAGAAMPLLPTTTTATTTTTNTMPFSPTPDSHNQQDFPFESTAAFMGYNFHPDELLGAGDYMVPEYFNMTDMTTTSMSMVADSSSEEVTCILEGINDQDPAHGMCFDSRSSKLMVILFVH